MCNSDTFKELLEGLSRPIPDHSPNNSLLINTCTCYSCPPAITMLTLRIRLLVANPTIQSSACLGWSRLWYEYFIEDAFLVYHPGVWYLGMLGRLFSSFRGQQVGICQWGYWLLRIAIYLVHHLKRFSFIPKLHWSVRVSLLQQNWRAVNKEEVSGW